MNRFLPQPNLSDLWRRGLADPFEDWSLPSLLRRNESSAQGFNPTCEVSEDKAHYTFKFDLPGIPKDQIRIELDDNRLTVSGERREFKEEGSKDSRRHFSEMQYGSFVRSFTLPTPVNAEKVNAMYDHGVLTVNLGKRDATASRQITVK